MPKEEFGLMGKVYGLEILPSVVPMGFWDSGEPILLRLWKLGCFLESKEYACPLKRSVVRV